MLFSQPEIASFLSESFECAWESVRPVPRLTVDFGDGRRLERTLRGNIATYLCTSDGATFDLVPGLVSGIEYVDRLRESLVLFEVLRAGTRDALDVASLSGDWHRMLANPERVRPADLARYRTRGERGPTAVRQAMNAVQRAMYVPPAQLTARPFVVDLESFGAAKPEVIRTGYSKMRVEGSLVRQLDDKASDVPRDAGLPLDDRHARERGYREAHVLLEQHGMQAPSALTRDVYSTLLHVDLDDPYLGLAPDVLGGEVGRH